MVAGMSIAFGDFIKADEARAERKTVQEEREHAKRARYRPFADVDEHEQGGRLARPLSNGSRRGDGEDRCISFFKHNVVSCLANPYRS